MKVFRRALVFGLALLCLFSSFSIPVFATQSMSGNFYTNYTLTGNPATDIALVALAQNGRSKASLGYTEPWCADFVSDCAKIIGQSNAIPFYGGVGGLYDGIINAGGYEVSVPKQGDIVFYDWAHVGIMSDSTNCISGNMGAASVVENYTYTGINVGSTIRIVRPNYSGSSTPPSTPTISVSGTTRQVGDSVQISFGNSSGASYFEYYVAEFPEAFGYYTNAKHGTVYDNSVTFTDLPAGHYSVFAHAGNGAGLSEQSNWVSFDVYEKDYIPVIRKEYNGHIYSVYDYPASWTFCRDLCTAMGGHLVTINSKEEQAFIAELVKSGAKDAYWIGASNYSGSAANQDGPWSWVTGETFNYTNWYTGEPSATGSDGTREHWAELRKSYSYKWNDVYNTNKANKGFIIEIEPKEKDITKRAVFDGHEYLLIDKNSTWSEAQGYCLHLGGQLCAINSAEEAAFIDSFIESGTRPWYYVGGVRRGNTWYWLDGIKEGEKITSINWNGDLWPSHCNYLMKYKASKKYINLPNTYYPEKDIAKIGFICEIPSAPVPVETITLSKSTLPLTVGETATLTATVLPSNATDNTVTWSSKDAKIASVNSSGKVTAVGPGTTTITASAGGKSATCTVTVSPKPEYSIGKLTLHSTSGTQLTAIPAGQFLVTVPVTKLTADSDALVFLAAYSAGGQYRGLMYVKVKNVPVNATVEVTLPVNNSGGDIAQLKAFVVSAIGNMTPLSAARSFPES